MRRHKLTPEAKAEIVRRAMAKDQHGCWIESHAALADIFGVSRPRITQLVREAGHRRIERYRSSRRPVRPVNPPDLSMLPVAVHELYRTLVTKIGSGEAMRMVIEHMRIRKIAA